MQIGSIWRCVDCLAQFIEANEIELRQVVGDAPGLSGVNELFVLRPEVWIETGGANVRHVKCLPDVGATTADVRAAVARL